MRFIFYLFILCFSAVVFASDITGVYAVASKGDESYVEIFQKNGKFYGVGFANKSGKDSGNDVKNPDPRLRDRKVGGSVFLWNLTHKKDNKYHGGKLYNFQNGDTYHVSAEWNDGVLKLRVSKDKRGTFGKTLSWRKMSDKEIAPYQAKRPKIETLQLPQ
ncbi:DUF2147 domain-containing protein [Helicobacter trogontum]|uniref:DUF2147 domain-containing protein n=1 Tax=Helicobacter trogontum TaxID=50960 RepID=A0A4U8SCK2_9HELI|nr:DUF2147 domain-containing protein [Helicobacter trogontum]TLD83838.1 DUF2147 domain-containing protein [Helicobacter trogontum]